MDGAPGIPGPAGISLFSVFVDDFFTVQGNPTGGIPVEIVQIEEPALGTINVQTGDADRVAYRVVIPAQYQGATTVVMRLFLVRQGGPMTGGQFSVRVFGKRLVDGSGTIDDYLDPAGRIVTVAPATSATEFKVIDLPLNVAVADGLGGTALAAGDFLAFELETVTTDGSQYGIVGVEFYDVDAANVPPAGNLGASIS
jgi:hypothetical protein